MNSLTFFAPAKINLFLAITGRRSDGYHELISLVAPLAWGDELTLEVREGEGVYSLGCDDPAVPVDETNLVLRAARLYQEANGRSRSVHFNLTKRIPLGAGLGGGSSDGTAALLGLNQINGNSLEPETLAGLAARLGSDCPMFLRPAPNVMRGRGERIDRLPDQAARRIRGRRLIVFKPSFGISTAWAYGQMIATAPRNYRPAVEAEAKLTTWLMTDDAPLEALIENNLETIAFEKFVALPALLNQLRTRFQITVGMSGSGSACYALLEENTLAEPVLSSIREAWGEAAFVRETRFG